MKGWANAWLIDSRFAGSRTRIFSRKSLSCVTLRSWSSGIRWPPTMSASRSLLGLIVLITVTFSCSIHWLTLSFRNTKVLHQQTLNPTAELWCKTFSRIKVDLVTRGLSSFGYLNALCRFGVIYRGLGLSLVLH